MVSTRSLRYKFSEGERVLCYEPDPTKAKVLYDSKVLEVIESKDKRGRRTVEYLIHFQGWNSSWDRCVGEDFVLKDTQENRQLQRDLAEKSQLQLGAYLYRKERKKRVTTTAHPGPAKRARHGCSDARSSTSTQPDEVDPGDSQSSNGSGSTSGSESGSSSSDSQQLRHKPQGFRADIPIPPALRDRLTFDYHLVVKRGRLARLPASPCAAEILESFVKWYAHTGVWQAARTRRAPPQRPDIVDVSCRLHLVREVAEGMRIYIDFILGDHLLYKQEQRQYWQVCGQYNEDDKQKSESEDSQEDDTAATDEEVNSPKLPEYSHLPPDPVSNQNNKEDTENDYETEEDEQDEEVNEEDEEDYDENEEDKEVQNVLHNNVENHSQESETDGDEEDEMEIDEEEEMENGEEDEMENDAEHDASGDEHDEEYPVHNNVRNEMNEALHNGENGVADDDEEHSNEESDEENALHNNVENVEHNNVHNNIENEMDYAVDNNEENDQDEDVSNDSENEDDDIVHNNIQNGGGDIVHNNAENYENNGLLNDSVNYEGEENNEEENDVDEENNEAENDVDEENNEAENDVDEENNEAENDVDEENNEGEIGEAEENNEAEIDVDEENNEAENDQDEENNEAENEGENNHEEDVQHNNLENENGVGNIVNPTVRQNDIENNVENDRHTAIKEEVNDEEMDVDDVAENDKGNGGEEIPECNGENDQGNEEDEDSKSKVMVSVDGRNSCNYPASCSDANNECEAEEVKVKLEVEVKVEVDVKLEVDVKCVKLEASSEEAEQCDDVTPRGRRCAARSGQYAKRLRSYKSTKSHSENEEQAPSTSTGGEQRPFDTQSSSVESTMSSLSEEWRGRAVRAPPPAPHALTRTPLSLLLEKVSKWRVIPREEKTKHLPCRIYGATHLARLFVKLPEFLNATNMAESKLKIILKNIDLFVQYLDEHGEWFGEMHYMEDARPDSH